MRITGLLLAIVAAFGAWCADVLPVDPALRTGTLPNGMTYYIRANSHPAERAEMWMVHRVGSVVEADDEQGYAHFLEHLAFNGTTHFPGQEMVGYLTSKGMGYGSDINASTNFDDVQYQMSNVPTNDWTVLDSVLLALSDLSCSLTLDEEAITKERGIIEEEWRHRNGYQMRMFDSVLPQLLGDNPYASRIPIGSIDLVRQADHHRLSGFYHKWFRPDLQAIVIVGDFDSGIMEQHVKQTFGAIATPPAPCPPAEVPVTLPAGLRYAHYSDAEASGSTVRLLYPIDNKPANDRNTLEELKDVTLRQLVAQMMMERFGERSREPGSNLLASSCTMDKYLSVGHCDALIITGTGDAKKETALLRELLTEVRRVEEHGFTPGELTRSAAAYRSAIDQARLEVDHHPSSAYVGEYIDHFLHGGYIPGVEEECRLIAQVLDTVTTAGVNAIARQMLNNHGVNVVITNANAADTPDSDEVTSIAASVALTPTSAPADNDVGHRPLIGHHITPGSIIKESTDAVTGATLLTLSNGATVQLLPTAHQNDEIRFGATRPGGYLAYPGQYDTEMRLIDDVVESSALGEWSQTDLAKRLSGIPLSLTYSMGEGQDDFTGTCRRDDVETLLQLTHLYFTDVRPDTTAHRLLRQQLLSQARQLEGNPLAEMTDSIGATLYNHRALYRPLTPADINGADFDDVLRLYRERVAPAGDYTFTLVGNFTIDGVRGLITRYLASLPAGQPAARTITPPHYPTGDVDNVFLTSMPSPKASVYTCLMGPMEHTMRNQLLIDITGQVMMVALTAHLRESLHATYAVEASGALSRLSGKWMLNAQFDTQPERTQTIVGEMARVFDIVMSYGTTGDLLENIRQQMLQQYDSDVRTNAYWMNVLRNRSLGFDSHSGYRELVESLTLAEVNAFIMRLDPELRLRVIQQGYRL